MNVCKYNANLIKKSTIIVDLKPYGELNHIFQGILSLEPLDMVRLTYNTGEVAIAEFLAAYIKGTEIYYDFLTNDKTISFKQVEVPRQCENIEFTFNVNNTKYVLCVV